jgi:hypothetical protein
MMRGFLHFCLVAALLSACHAASSASPPFPGRLGVEASGDAFVDLVRQNYRWEKPDGHGGWTKLARADVDEHGWPRTDCRWIMDARPCAEWAGEIDDPEAYRVDRGGVCKGSFPDLGGNLAMQFTLSGAYSRCGARGLTDDVSKPDRNALFPEVRQLIGGGK